MSKRLKLSGGAYRRLKTSRNVSFNEICWIHRRTRKENRKNRKKKIGNDEKAGERAEKARPIIENEKQDPSSF